MEKKIYRSYNYTFRLCLTVGMFVFALASTVAVIVTALNINSGKSFLVTLAVLLVAVCCWYISFNSLKTLATYVYSTDEGLGLSRYGKTIVFIKWEDIVQTGIGLALSGTSKIKKLYFADKPLEEKEKEDLDSVQKSSVYFSNLSEEWYELLKEKCPVSLPNEAKDFILKKDDDFRQL